jgi:hypothetical protein
LKTTTGTPAVCVFSALATVSVALQRNHLIVPGELIRPRRGRSGGDIVEVRAHGQRPGVVETLQRILAAAQPFGGNRGLLGGVGQRLLVAQPALHVGLRGERPGRVVGQLHFAGIARQTGGFRRRQVEEQLVGGGRDHVQRPLAHAAAAGHDALQHFDGVLLGSAADVAGAVVVVIGWYARSLPVALHARRPVALIAAESAVALPTVERLPRARRQLLRRFVERGRPRLGR